MKFSTEAIHAGQTPDKTTGAVTTPIFMTSTYVQDELGVNKGYHYGRTENLTRESLEKNIATLEKGESGISFSSGIAAIHSLMNLVKSGENVIVPESVYGGTFRLFQDFVSNYGVEFKWIDMSDLGLVEKSIDSNTKLIYMETPSNPLLKLTDIEGITQIARARNILTAADNTFMTPYFQRPLELGADIAENGMVLTGGGALLHDIDRLLMEETGLPVIIADDPLTCVARGGGRALEMIDETGTDVFTTE